MTCDRPARPTDRGALGGGNPVGDDRGDRRLVAVERALDQAPAEDQDRDARSDGEHGETEAGADRSAEQEGSASATGAAGSVAQRAEDRVGDQADRRPHAEDDREVALLVRLVERDQLLTDQHLPRGVERHPHGDRRDDVRHHEPPVDARL
jgi:hypothetical protein